MAKDNKQHTITLNKKVKYKADADKYTIQLCHPRRPWWLLLLLLPLLLLIQCHKDVTAVCLEPDSGAPITDQPVTLEYEAHWLWNNGRLFATDSIKLTQSTDDQGETVFRDLPCSVYSYIFYCLSQMSLTAKSQCHAAAGEKHNFHYTSRVELKMLPRREDLHIMLRDLDTDDPLPGATLIYQYVELGEEHTDSALADAEGVAMIPQMRYCSVMKLLLGRLYGYADTTRINAPCQQLVVPNDSATLRLRPLKEKFTFFVKNVETKQPIPDAICHVSLTHPVSKKTVTHPPVRTSTDGKGRAMFSNAFILATIQIAAEKKPHYRDSVLTGGPWTVQAFVKQDDNTRTVWLKPLPYKEEFINVDSLNGRPIPGVKNKIKVTDPDGTVHNYEETSNANGIFYVWAKEDSKVEIVSTKSPDYKEKQSSFAKFKAINDKKIRMQPVMVELEFRTVDAERGKLLPGCNLSVSGSISGSLQASTGNTSGSGAFTVRFRRAETISIRATKSGYKPTTSKVSNKGYDYLQADQERRDIPLKADPVVYKYQGNNKSHNQCYDMGEAPCTFRFDYSTCSACTMLIVSDGNGNEITRVGIDSPGGNSQGTKYTAPSGSTTLQSPTQQVCVTVVDVNGCNATYTITKK